MNKKTVPFNEEQIRSIIAKYPTPFHIYDEKAIVDNVRKLIKAFDWAYDFKEYFAVKATPNPYIMRLLQKEGVGADCSSMAELELCDKVGIKGHDIVFSSNDTPYAEFKRAMELGALVNLDDISMIDFMEKRGPLPEWICARYNPGPLLKGGNDIIGTPEEAKYGMTREQIIDAFRILKDKGVKHFGLHTMVVSNELHVNGLINTAKMMFELAVEVQNMLGINIEFLDFGGGIGLPYRPEESFIDYDELSAGIKKNFEAIMEPAGLRMWPCHHRPLRLPGHDGHPSQTHLERIHRRRRLHGQPHASGHVWLVPSPDGHGQRKCAERPRLRRCRFALRKLR